MNLGKFNELMRLNPPGQWPKEWQFFLEFVDGYFKNRGIIRPTVVELGTCRNNQKIFYKELLGAKHIGIDISNEFGEPDILGDTHDAKTLAMLKTKLAGRQINLLFIDAAHSYGDVKKDYEMYSPLVKNIVAFHDIMTPQFQVRVFWKELIENERDYTEVFFYKWSFRKYQYGIGLIVKE